MERVPRAAIETLRGLVAQHLCECAAAGVSFFESDYDEYLAAALRYARAAHPWPGEAPDDDAAKPRRWWGMSMNDAVTDALLALEEVTTEAVVAALVAAVPLEVVDERVARRAVAPQLYADLPDLPAALGSTVGAHETWGWYDCSFRVMTEGDWLDDRAPRDAVFAALASHHHVYGQLSFVEVGRDAARRLARSLLARPDGRAKAREYDAEARALVTAYGPGTRAFASRDLDADELADPFAHGDEVDLSSEGNCAGGKFLALVVTDGRRLTCVDALWDTWSE